MANIDFKPGTYFKISGQEYIVLSKTPYPADHRFMTVNVARCYDSLDEYKRAKKSQAYGYFFLHELKEWAKKGVCYDIWIIAKI